MKKWEDLGAEMEGLKWTPKSKATSIVLRGCWQTRALQHNLVAGTLPL